MSKKTKQQIKHNFAALTKYIRDKCNSDYKEQADVLGISPYQISRWRTQGEPGQPDESHFEVLERAYSITRQEWLMNTSNVNVKVNRLEERVDKLESDVKLLSAILTRSMNPNLDEYRAIARRNKEHDQD